MQICSSEDHFDPPGQVMLIEECQSNLICTENIYFTIIAITSDMALSYIALEHSTKPFGFESLIIKSYDVVVYLQI